MPSPFPGMNPYLELPAGWTGIHHWLITGLASSLGVLLPPHYYVAVEERVYEISDAESALIGIPDHAIARTTAATPRPTQQQGNVATLSQPTTVILPMPIGIKESYLEVRKAGTHQVVTVIEVLSPTNKQGEGRSKYEEKRQTVLASSAHLVEIDLLRQGKPMAFSGAIAPTHYRILVSRSQRRPKADLYGFNLQDLMPIFAMPLAGNDAEPAINLKTMLDQLYDLGRYDLQIDYTQAPTAPKLSDADRDWCDQILQQNHLRPQ
jgi:Protein of unknown function (DUF4058)